MKKFFLLLFLSSFALIGNAQTGLHVGPKMFAGASFIFPQNSGELLANVPDSLIQLSELGYNLKFAYFFGGTALYNFKRDIGIQMDILYFSGGQKYSDVFCLSCAERYEIEKNINLKQLVIPVMFKYTFGRNAYLKGYAMGGPYFGITIAGTEFGLIQTINNATNANVNVFRSERRVLDAIRPFDLGFNFEGGLNIYVAQKVYISTGLTTSVSFFDINSSNVIKIVSKNDNSYTGARNVRMGFTFGLNFVIWNNIERTNKWLKGGF